MSELTADERTWSVTRAKAQFGDMLKRADIAPQMITRHGKPFAVVVSARERHRKAKRRESLAEFLMASPLRGTDLDVERLWESAAGE